MEDIIVIKKQEELDEKVKKNINQNLNYNDLITDSATVKSLQRNVDLQQRIIETRLNQINQHTQKQFIQNELKNYQNIDKLINAGDETKSVSSGISSRIISNPKYCDNTNSHKSSHESNSEEKRENCSITLSKNQASTAVKKRGRPRKQFESLA